MDALTCPTCGDPAVMRLLRLGKPTLYTHADGARCKDRSDRLALDPEPLFTVVRAVQTCSGCPSQWDAWTADDKYLYLRYRYGHGTVSNGEGTQYTAFDHGHPLDGQISLEEFARLANLRLEIR